MRSIFNVFHLSQTRLASFPGSHIYAPLESVGYNKNMIRAYEEIVDFIAAGVTPDELVRYEASPLVKEIVERLVSKEKASGLSADEASELGHYLHIEHLVRLAKARAQGRGDDQLHQR